MARGKLQRAILELLSRTEVEDCQGRRWQYRLLRQVVGELYAQLESPADPHEPIPHAFDVSVRRAMRTLAARDLVRMRKLSLRDHAAWACWLPGHDGPLAGPYSNRPPLIGADVRRAILECLRDMGPGDPRRGHPYFVVFAATGKMLGRWKSQNDVEVLRGPFSKAVHRLADEGHVEIDSQDYTRFIRKCCVEV